jgi:methylated-DNA-[protein]-cysteine S-methyltransferase
MIAQRGESARAGAPRRANANRPAARQAMFYDYVDSPVGRLTLAGDAEGLHHVAFELGRHPLWIDESWYRDTRPFKRVREQLSAYFAGTLTQFDVDLAPQGSAFDLRVWDELRRIAYGATISYGELARRVGDAAAARAVGAANGRNPLPIIVPCHRVIGANGSLTGFGGGLATKKFLLEHEQRFAGFALT